MMSLAERVWAKVELRDGCWIWTGATDGRYGIVWSGDGMEKAHRAVYRMVVGPIAAGFHVDHLCEQTLCVRPLHLEAVSELTNLRREARSRRLVGARPANYGTHTEVCPKGHPKTPDNTRVSRGWNLCRVCERERRARRAA